LLQDCSITSRFSKLWQQLVCDPPRPRLSGVDCAGLLASPLPRPFSAPQPKRSTKLTVHQASSFSQLKSHQTSGAIRNIERRPQPVMRVDLERVEAAIPASELYFNSHGWGRAVHVFGSQAVARRPDRVGSIGRFRTPGLKCTRLCAT
jgi:hypothetical protein